MIAILGFILKACLAVFLLLVIVVALMFFLHIVLWGGDESPVIEYMRIKGEVERCFCKGYRSYLYVGIISPIVLERLKTEYDVTTETVGLHRYTHEFRKRERLE